MSLALMSQVWFCLLSAFGLGLLVGWLGKKLSVSQKPPTSLRRDEVLAQNRERLAKEREIATQINALRTQVEIATTTLQSREAALAKLETDLIEQFATLSAANAQIEKLQTRLTATEDALQQNTQSATTLGVEVRTLRSELENRAQEFRQMLPHMEERNASLEQPREHENQIAELTARLQSLLKEKEIAISHLQAQVTTLEPLRVQLSECKSTLQEAEASYQTAARDKDAEIIRLQAQINALKFPNADSAIYDAKVNELKTRYQATLREKEETIARLQARIAGLEMFLHRKTEPSTVPLQLQPSVHHRTPTSLPREWLATRPRVSTTDLTEIKSLNDEYLPILRQAGITTRAALLEKGTSPEGQSEISHKTGIPLSLISQWVRHAEFLRLKGMSGVYAELLDAAGVNSVTELTKCTAETLHQKFLDVNAAKRLSRILPILAQIRDWIEQAKDLPHRGKEPHLSVVGPTS
jgi:hypothetical protein